MSYGIGQFWRAKVSGKEWLDEYNNAMASRGPVERLRQWRRGAIGTSLLGAVGVVATIALLATAAAVASVVAAAVLTVLALCAAAWSSYKTKHITSKVKDATHKRQWFMNERQKLGPTIDPGKQYVAYSGRQVVNKGWSKWTAALLAVPTSGASIPIYGVYSLMTSHTALKESKAVNAAAQAQKQNAPLALGQSSSVLPAGGLGTGFQNLLSGGRAKTASAPVQESSKTL